MLFSYPSVLPLKMMGFFCFVLVFIAVLALLFFHLPFFLLLFVLLLCGNVCVILGLHLVAILVSSTWLLVLPSNAKAEDKMELFGHTFFIIFLMFFSSPSSARVFLMLLSFCVPVIVIF